MRTLVAGWFSFEGLGATAGDLLARDVVAAWLDEAGEVYDIANAAPFEGGVDWRRVDPDSYGRLVFVCGPFYVRRRLLRRLSLWMVSALNRAQPVLRRLGLDPHRRIGLELLVSRFGHARLIGVDVSVLGGAAGAEQPFDRLWARDGAGQSRPDLVFLAPGDRVPVVGLVFVERQGEYGSEGRHDRAETALRNLAEGVGAACVSIDTRLDVPNPLRSPVQIESAIARMDVVLTTRLHGMVLALKNGVPAIVVDPIAGGAKVLAQARVLGWPFVFTAEEAGGAALRKAFEQCLGAEARAQAEASAERARGLLEEVRLGFLDELT